MKIEYSCTIYQHNRKIKAMDTMAITPEQAAKNIYYRLAVDYYKVKPAGWMIRNMQAEYTVDCKPKQEKTQNIPQQLDLPFEERLYRINL